MYRHIFAQSHTVGAYRKETALYKGKDEEGIRDQFLFLLKRYESITATGETFNKKGGKIDIILSIQKIIQMSLLPM